MSSLAVLTLSTLLEIPLAAVLIMMCGRNCVGIGKKIQSFSFFLYNFNSDLFTFVSNNANQKGYKEWKGLNWSCNCCLEGEEQTGGVCESFSHLAAPQPQRVPDPAVLPARVGSPHTPPPSSTFPSSRNCFHLTSGTFSPNRQHFLS